jgi:hypothetical protein
MNINEASSSLLKIVAFGLNYLGKNCVSDYDVLTDGVVVQDTANQYT